LKKSSRYLIFINHGGAVAIFLQGGSGRFFTAMDISDIYISKERRKKSEKTNTENKKFLCLSSHFTPKRGLFMNKFSQVDVFLFIMFDQYFNLGFENTSALA
jgi:hypothetical protein